MSKVEGASFSSSSIPGTPYIDIKHVENDAPSPDVSANGDFLRTASVSEAPPTPQPQQEEVAPNGSEQPMVADIKPGSSSLLNVDEVVAQKLDRSRVKGRTEQETEIIAQTAARICSRLAGDQSMALNPDADTPFVDAEDAVKRLLPYHIFQHPMEDLVDVENSLRKGKRKATEEDLLRQEIAETRFALQCWKRRVSLEKRFRKTRINEGKRTGSDEQAYWLAQAVLEGDRLETAALNAELRSARQELEKIEREKRAAQAAAAAATAAATATTPTTARPTYYPPQATSTTAYSTQYRNYTYPYTSQNYSSYTYQPYGVNGTATTSYSTAATFSSTPTRSTYTPQTTASTATLPTPANTGAQTSNTASSEIVAASNGTIPSASAPAPATSATSATTTSSSSSTPIPIMLPSTSLPALAALGITPVPAADAPPANEPQPAVLLKGTTHNGLVSNLEINVMSLQPNQLSGLALILNALTSRGGTTTAGSSSGTPAGTSAATVKDMLEGGGETGTGTGTRTAANGGSGGNGGGGAGGPTTNGIGTTSPSASEGPTPTVAASSESVSC